jgi:mRNA interferase YafQ
MLRIEYYTQFKKDLRRAKSRGLNENLLKEVITILAKEEQLPAKFRDHQLLSSRKYKNMRECHIQPDWLLIYCVDDGNLILTLVRTGTHSDLY